jgi:hypothetical protein
MGREAVVRRKQLCAIQSNNARRATAVMAVELALIFYNLPFAQLIAQVFQQSENQVVARQFASHFAPWRIFRGI